MVDLVSNRFDMPKVAIVTDTASQVSRGIATEFGIKTVSLHVTIGGKSYREDEMDLPWFCKELPRWQEEGTPITTSAPSAGDFLDAYRELSGTAKAVLAVCISSRFSATFQSAQLAKKIASDEIPDETVEVFDTMTVCGAQMLIAIEAAREALAGKELDQVIGRAERIRARVNCVSLSSDVSNLVKYGRIHGAKFLAEAMVANTALMEATMATGGEHKPLGRYATRTKALDRMIDIVKERSGGGGLHVAINHADASSEAEELKGRVSSEFRCQEIFISQSMPLVTYHEGLGNLKLCWWGDE